MDKNFEIRATFASERRPKMISQCVRFEPNCFNKGKCKNCYKSKEQHSVESLVKAKSSSGNPPE